MDDCFRKRGVKILHIIHVSAIFDWISRKNATHIILREVGRSDIQKLVQTLISQNETENTGSHTCGRGDPLTVDGGRGGRCCCLDPSGDGSGCETEDGCV